MAIVLCIVLFFVLLYDSNVQSKRYHQLNGRINDLEESRDEDVNDDSYEA